MAQNFIACDREQSFLLPPDVREWLPESHLAWFVMDAVDVTEVAEQLLRAAVESAAARLHSEVASQPDGHLTETRHLKPALKLALAEMATNASLSVQVSHEHEFRVPEWRSRAGVDLASTSSRFSSCCCTRRR